MSDIDTLERRVAEITHGREPSAPIVRKLSEEERAPQTLDQLASAMYDLRDRMFKNNDAMVNVSREAVVLAQEFDNLLRAGDDIRQRAAAIIAV